MCTRPEVGEWTEADIARTAEWCYDLAAHDDAWRDGGTVCAGKQERPEVNVTGGCRRGRVPAGMPDDCAPFVITHPFDSAVRIKHAHRYNTICFVGEHVCCSMREDAAKLHICAHDVRDGRLLARERAHADALYFDVDTEVRRRNVNGEAWRPTFEIVSVGGRVAVSIFDRHHIQWWAVAVSANTDADADADAGTGRGSGSGSNVRDSDTKLQLLRTVVASIRMTSRISPLPHFPGLALVSNRIVDLTTGQTVFIFKKQRQVFLAGADVFAFAMRPCVRVHNLRASFRTTAGRARSQTQHHHAEHRWQSTFSVGSCGSGSGHSGRSGRSGSSATMLACDALVVDSRWPVARERVAFFLLRSIFLRANTTTNLCEPSFAQKFAAFMRDYATTVYSMV